MRFVEVERRNPTEQELQNPNILVGDVGMEFNPELNNFDHHQDKNLGCAFQLVATTGTIEQSLEKIIVHGGFVAHLDEIYMVAYIDISINRAELYGNIDIDAVYDFMKKISCWDTQGPNVFAKKYPDEAIPPLDSFRNFLQEKWAQNPNSTQVREIFMKALFNADGSYSGFDTTGFETSDRTLFEQYHIWISKKRLDKEKRTETLNNTGLSLIYTKKRTSILVLNEPKPLSDIDGLQDSFLVLDYVKEQFNIEPDIMVSIQKNRDGGNLCSIFRTAKGEENGIDLYSIDLGEATIFKHKAGFLHNIKTEAFDKALDELNNL